MCGRYTNTSSDAGSIAARFAFDERGIRPGTLGRANVCPTEQVLVAVADAAHGRRAESVRWGLAPSWGTLKGARPLINARDDKLRSSGAWRRLAERAEHRCLVIADGWLEWQKPEDRGQPRQPFLHRRPDREPFCFAGLWCTERPKDGDGPVASCLVVTVPANREAAILHDRMPAVLAGPEEEAAWLDPAVDLDGTLELARSLPDGSLDVLPVSPRLSRAGVEGLELLERHDGQSRDGATPDAGQLSLL
jgi:putative SOS response-associated peptidase YedK